MNLALAAFKLSYQLSPIVLTNGIVANLLPGGALPIIAITEAANFVDGLLSGTTDLEFANFFANFEPVAGATLIEQDLGRYPFANQAVAANATIAQPLRVSMVMKCPVTQPNGYAVKLATLLALQAVLKQHNASGGTYTVITPSYYYTNCVMLNMRDISSGESNQYQHTWQLDFEQPLLTLQAAQQAQNSLMSKIASATKIDGNPTWSSISTTVGQPPSLASLSAIPAASQTAGTGVAQLSGLY